jgi:hypothetical protein
MMSRYLAITTLLMSIPLLLSYNLKFGPFPQGIPYVLVWSWAVVSFFAVPVLLAFECVVAGWIALKAVGVDRKVLSWHYIAIPLAIIAEIIALYVRRHGS